MQHLKALFIVATLGAVLTANATVAIVTGGFYTPNLRNDLIAQGISVAEISSYTAASLAGYDAVIVYGNDFIDMSALTTYATGGGRVIETPWFWLNNAPTPALTVVSQGGAAVYHGSFPGVTVLDGANSLLSGVTFPAAGPAPDLGRTTGNTFVSGVDQIAKWSDGTAFIGEKSLGAGEVIAINMHVITSDTAYTIIDQPWATQLFVNAIGGVAPVPEPSTYIVGSMLLLPVGVQIIRRHRHAKLTA